VSSAERLRRELSRTAIALFYGLVGNASTERQIALVMAVSVLGGVGIALLGLLTSDWHTNKSPFLAPLYGYLPRISLPAFLGGQLRLAGGPVSPQHDRRGAGLIPFDIALLGWYNSSRVGQRVSGDHWSKWGAQIGLRKVLLRITEPTGDYAEIRWGDA